MNEENDVSTSKYYQVIGERIAERRKTIKMRQEGLANSTGLSRVHISNIEGGRCGTPIPTLYKIAKALKTDIYGLLPKDIDEINELAVNITINELARNMGINPAKHGQELREMVEKINRMKQNEEKTARVILSMK